MDHADVAAAIRAIATAPLRATGPDATPTKRELIETVAVASTALDAARDSLEECVRLARRHGVSWAEIGQVLGITRQAAFQRFGS